MRSIALLFCLLFIGSSGEPEPSVNVNINVNVNGESEKSIESGISCSLEWNHEEYRPLIMIRESKTIIPPIIDKDISNNPNRIPLGIKLIFACPGENNQFNHVNGTHTKLHGECTAPEQFKVCVNNFPEFLDLSQLSCSSNMFPSFIKDNDTSDKKSCDGIGGELYKTGYTYGDYHEFKDLEIEVCFREKNQTTLCTSPNLNGNETDYKASRGFLIGPNSEQNTRTNSECGVGSGTTLLACKNLNGKCVPRLEACPKCQPLVTPPGNPYCLKDYHCCYSGLTERFVQEISTSARVNQVTFEDDDVSGEDDVSQRFKRQAVFSPKNGCLRAQLFKGLFDLDHQIRISKNIPIGTTAFSNPPLIDSAMEFMDWKTNPVISVNNPLFKVTDEDILYDLGLKGMDNFRQAWSNLKAPTENDLKHFQSMVMDMDAMKQSLPDDAADPLTMKLLEHYFRGDRKGMEYTGIHDGYKSIAYGGNTATPYTGGDVLNIVPFTTARVVSIRNAKIKWNDNDEFVKPGITTVVYGMPPVYQTRFLLSTFYEQQTRLQLQKNVGIQIRKDKTNPNIWGTGFFYV